mmetsp:Transcript_54389/g.140512  ORF Transcript_54389/g.140512 Transcript_54389/m.140512 type:complete len:269 (+) Transcript_54389:105-911(+)|eukprot:CAMPEP_0115856068 /NCGR_PEP_ID=MMETSP0287-20121206/14862_1 /TAXON_ID=412157 /ORGANISM="Chrysochromulina rotalis, Strain UIO044" /LENGTH=268 /DNA_ID=CAMNT_0003310231 /DNA_START=94 /DNA_END=900 /DNA_ORIENTATION=+
MPSRPSWESTLNFSGVLAAVFGPYVVLFVTVVAKQPELIILTIGSAFIWMCAILTVAVIWWMFLPLRDALWLVLLYGVAIQELSRWMTYALYDRLLTGLRKIGLQPTPQAGRPAGASLVPAAIASALGAGTMQTLVMYGDVLGGALLPGTLYTPACSALSVFAVDALYNLGFQLLHVLLGLIGWLAAYPRKSRPLIAAMVALHLLASGASLLNSAEVGGDSGGCMVALPCLFATVLITGTVAASVAAASLCAPPTSSPCIDKGSDPIM